MLANSKKNVGNNNFKNALKYKEFMEFLLPNLSLIISEKCAVSPSFPFLIPIALAKTCFFHTVINCAKIPLY